MLVIGWGDAQPLRDNIKKLAYECKSKPQKCDGFDRIEKIRVMITFFDYL